MGVRVQLCALLLAAPLVVACGGGSGSGGGSCTASSDCDAGFVCIDDLCVPRGVDSGATDAAADAGDAGSMCVDSDGDGADGLTSTCATGTDCDDSDRAIAPGASELCGDGVDNDCDGDADEAGCVCARGDRITCYTGPAATRAVGACRVGVSVCIAEGEAGDCNGEVLPVEEVGDELCDGIDNDCDGTTDEGLRNACGECAVEVAEACGDGIDNDCDGMVDEDCDCDFRCECPDMTSCECRPPTNQPCYEGPFGTEGRGDCGGGRRDCIADPATGANTWGMCVGQVTPGEECVGGAADGDDDDCDGIVDEGCIDADGDGSPWPTDCDDTDPDRHPGADEVCDGDDDNCDGVADEGVTNACGGCGAPTATDTCDNGLDDDCNGLVDDGCSCEIGSTQECYGGPEGTAGMGTCSVGSQTCGGTEFTDWGECTGWVGPTPEFCDGMDNDCDGVADERWAAGSNACGFCDGTELCDGEDNDCDGLVDEGVRNLCGDCGPAPVEVCDGVDNNCDGVVDEGVTNACGTCFPEPCFTDTWDTPSDCMAEGRACDSIEEHPDFPGSVTLGQSTTDFDYIYIAVTARNEVAQLDTSTGAVNWIAPSHGRYPSRTAVAVDGSVWVGNRAHTASVPTDPAQSNVVHLSAVDGSLICRAPVLNVARSVAIDGMGDIWAGSFNNGDVYHISGTDVDTSTSPPTCRVIRTISTGRNVYGLAADPDGFIWTSSNPAVRISIADYSQTTVTNPSHYGIAPDGSNRIWYGGWLGGGTVHSIDRTSFAVTNTGIGQITAVTVHPDGSVWGSSYGTNEIVGFNSDGTLKCRAAIPAGSGANPHGVAVDRMGRIWMPSRFTSGAVNVFDTDCGFVATYPVSVGQELYSYSDMTGHLLRTFVAPEGSWTQDFDSGYATPYWTSVEWDSDEPAGTGIEMTVQSADTVAGLDAATPCGPFAASAADLSTCPADLHRHRHLRVNARLFRSGTSERPVLHEIRATWAY